MTREEAQIIIGNIPIKPEVLDNCYSIADYQEAKTMAIKALEQQPCKDAISRQAVVDAIAKTIVNGESLGYTLAYEILCDLPPVTPKQKMGRWILSGGYWRCSECKEKALLKLDKSKGNCREYMPAKSNNCPNCGVKMQEVGE